MLALLFFKKKGGTKMKFIQHEKNFLTICALVNQNRDIFIIEYLGTDFAPRIDRACAFTLNNLQNTLQKSKTLVIEIYDETEGEKNESNNS